MRKLAHPHLLKVYAVCTKEEPIFIVTELMTHGSLLEYLRQGEGQNAAAIQCIGMLAQIVSGRHMIS